MSKITVAEQAAPPAAPSAGKVVIYAKTDGRLYAKDDAGTEYVLGITLPLGLTDGGTGGTSADTALTALGFSAFIKTLIGDADAEEVKATLEIGDSFPSLQVGGRLTLSSGVPVTSADVADATTVYFSPYNGNTLPLYDGSTWVLTTFAELSQTTADTTKSPAAVANNSNYDMFVWNDSGTIRCTRGPAWTSDIARGAGIGTTELELFEGHYVNKVAISNGPAAKHGLYVGSIRSNSSAQINDTKAFRHVWNKFNRVKRCLEVVEATSSWTYSLSAYRQANGAASNQLDFLRGLDEDDIIANIIGTGSSSGVTPRIVAVAIGLDSTTTPASLYWINVATSSSRVFLSAHYSGMPGLGRHILVWLERGAGADTQTFNGNNLGQSGIVGSMLA